MSDRARVCHNSGAAKKKINIQTYACVTDGGLSFKQIQASLPRDRCRNPVLRAISYAQSKRGNYLLKVLISRTVRNTSAPLHGQQKENARHLNGHNPLVPFPGQKGFSTGICHLDNLQMENASLLHGPFRPPPNSLAARRSRRAACASAQLETAGANGPGCLAEPVVTEADRLVGSGQAGRAGLGWPRPGPRPNCGPTRCSQLTLVAKSKGPCR